MVLHLPVTPKVDAQCVDNELPVHGVCDIVHLGEVSNIPTLPAQLVNTLALVLPTWVMPGASWAGEITGVGDAGGGKSLGWGG